MTLIYLIRHGRTDWNEERRVMGLSPVPVNDRGKEMVARLAGFLVSQGIETIYTGTLVRTMETARILGESWGAEIVDQPLLNESPYEKWTGKRYSELTDDTDFKLYSSEPTRSRFSDNEGMADIQRRVLDSIERIVRERPGKKTALVSHSDVIKPAIAHFLGMGLDEMHKLSIANASVSLLDMKNPGSPRMRYINLMPWKWPEKLFEGWR